MTRLIRINERDNVAVALAPVMRGETVTIGEGGPSMTLRTAEEIPQGHKIALRDIACGENIIKYGFPIGHATRDIRAGSWVHTHNVKTNLQGEVEYSYDPQVKMIPPAEPVYFRGFLRKDGRAAVRNEIWILPTTGCVNGVVSELARQNQDLAGGRIDGIYAFPHPFGCSQTGEDHARTRKLLSALADHPNAGAVLVVSLGCENLTRRQFTEALGEYDPDRIRFLTCQDVEDEYAAGRALLKECAAFAQQFERQKVPAGMLVVGMKCGGSDGLSGITANPVVGAFSDLLCAQGGTSILTEVPEMFGAEGMLLNRCVSGEVFEKAVRMLNGFKQYFISHHEVVYDNPSPGNKEGGISTLEDKSCGCVQKGGSAPIVDVLDYADRVRKSGLNLMYGPGNDMVSATALTAAGAHIILFTTGRGTPFGAPAPTVKIASGTHLCRKKPGWIDFNAGSAAEGESIPRTAGNLMDLVLAVAEGKQTCSERHGFREISILKDGVVL